MNQAEWEEYRHYQLPVKQPLKHLRYQGENEGESDEQRTKIMIYKFIESERLMGSVMFFRKVSYKTNNNNVCKTKGKLMKGKK